MTDAPRMVNVHDPVKKRRRYYVLMFLFSGVLLPFLLSWVFLGVLLLLSWLSNALGDAFSETSLMLCSVAATALCSALLGRIAGRRKALPETALARYLPLLLPAFISAALASAGLLLEETDIGQLFLMALTFINMPALPALFIFMFSRADRGILILMYAAVYLPFVFAMHRAAGKQQPVLDKRKLISLATAAAAAVIMVLVPWSMRQSRLVPDDTAMDPRLNHNVDVSLYRPFDPNNRLILPQTEPSLAISGNYPRLDGAIAVYPMYAALVQAVYKGVDEHGARTVVDCSNTPWAYSRLIMGEIDVFFGAQPSEQQITDAREQKLEFTLTPIAREAFVFFVNKDNPVNSLTMEQIRSVYTRGITDWKELGGEEGKILAFQRNEGSGSQTVMLAKVMEGKPMARPLEEERSAGMGGIIRDVAQYRNSKNALGYSFRWYATVLNPDSGIKLLKIDGIAPTVENIKNGSYPFTVPVYAVTARPRNPETQNLIDWLTGAEGKAFIKRNGYVAAE